MKHEKTEIMAIEELNSESFDAPQTVNGDYILLVAYASPGDLFFTNVIYSSSDKAHIEKIRDKILRLISYHITHHARYASDKAIKNDKDEPIKTCPTCSRIYTELKNEGVKLELYDDGVLHCPIGLQIRNIEEFFSGVEWSRVNISDKGI